MSEGQLTKEPIADKRAAEFEAIGQMIDLGTKHGLLAEIIWSFGQDMAGGSEIREAVAFACSEWDV